MVLGLGRVPEVDHRLHRVDRAAADGRVSDHVVQVLGATRVLHGVDVRPGVIDPASSISTPRLKPCNRWSSITVICALKVAGCW